MKSDREKELEDKLTELRAELTFKSAVIAALLQHEDSIVRYARGTKVIEEPVIRIERGVGNDRCLIASEGLDFNRFTVHVGTLEKDGRVYAIAEVKDKSVKNATPGLLGDAEVARDSAGRKIVQ